MAIYCHGVTSNLHQIHPQNVRIRAASSVSSGLSALRYIVSGFGIIDGLCALIPAFGYVWGPRTKGPTVRYCSDVHYDSI